MIAPIVTRMRDPVYRSSVIFWAVSATDSSISKFTQNADCIFRDEQRKLGLLDHRLWHSRFVAFQTWRGLHSN